MSPQSSPFQSEPFATDGKNGGCRPTESEGTYDGKSATYTRGSNISPRDQQEGPCLGVPGTGARSHFTFFIRRDSANSSEGATVVRKSPTEFGAFMVSEMNKWEQVVKKGGIKAE